MIHYVGFSPNHDGLSEVPEIELELIEIPEKNIVILLPGDSKENVQEIVLSLNVMIDVVLLFPCREYPQYEKYTIPGEDNTTKEVYMFPPTTLYQDIKKVMKAIQKEENIMGTGSNKIIIGIPNKA